MKEIKGKVEIMDKELPHYMVVYRYNGGNIWYTASIISTDKQYIIDNFRQYNGDIQEWALVELLLPFREEYDNKDN